MIASNEKTDVRKPQQSACDADQNTLPESELRRLMYERMARSSALAEVEENARHKWDGR